MKELFLVHNIRIIRIFQTMEDATHYAFASANATGHNVAIHRGMSPFHDGDKCPKVCHVTPDGRVIPVTTVYGQPTSVTEGHLK